MRWRIFRRSVSSFVSPGPRVPMPPPSRESQSLPPTSRGRRYLSCASSTCSLPSRVRARAAKMSRMSCVRSTTLLLQPRFDLPQLGRRQLVVEDDEVDVGLVARRRRARRSCRCRGRSPASGRSRSCSTRSTTSRAGRRGQAGQFVERPLGLRAPHGTGDEADQGGALRVSQRLQHARERDRRPPGSADARLPWRRRSSRARRQASARRRARGPPRRRAPRSPRRPWPAPAAPTGSRSSRPPETQAGARPRATAWSGTRTATRACFRRGPPTTIAGAASTTSVSGPGQKRSASRRVGRRHAARGRSTCAEVWRRSAEAPAPAARPLRRIHAGHGPGDSAGRPPARTACRSGRSTSPPRDSTRAAAAQRAGLGIGGRHASPSPRRPLYHQQQGWFPVTCSERPCPTCCSSCSCSASSSHPPSSRAPPATGSASRRCSANCSSASLLGPTAAQRARRGPSSPGRPATGGALDAASGGPRPRGDRRHPAHVHRRSGDRSRTRCAASATSPSGRRRRRGAAACRRRGGRGLRSACRSSGRASSSARS